MKPMTRTLDTGKTEEFVYIPSKVYDNKILLENDPTYIDKLHAVGSKELVNAWLHGDWNAVEGAFFDNFSSTRHVLEPFKIPDHWTKFRSMDWGSAAPFSVGWWAEADGTSVNGTAWPRGTLFRIAEWYGARPDAQNEGIRLSNEEVAEGIKLRQQGDMPGYGALAGLHVQPGPADASIFSVLDGASWADDFAGHGVPWTRAVNAPGSRKAGWLKVRALLKASLQRPMEEEGVFIFDTCRDFIETVPVLPRDERDPEDADTHAEDHIADEFRYRVFRQEVVAVGPVAGGVRGVRWN